MDFARWSRCWSRRSNWTPISCRRVLLVEAYGRIVWFGAHADGAFEAKARALVADIGRRWPDTTESRLSHAQFDYTVRRDYAAALAQKLGLSLGDRACLALALRRNIPALTADHVWSKLRLPIAIRQICATTP